MLHAQELEEDEVGVSFRHCLLSASVYVGVTPDASGYSGFLITLVDDPDLSALTIFERLQSVAISALVRLYLGSFGLSSFTATSFQSTASRLVFLWLVNWLCRSGVEPTGLRPNDILICAPAASLSTPLSTVSFQCSLAFPPQLLVGDDIPVVSQLLRNSDLGELLFVFFGFLRRIDQMGVPTMSRLPQRC